MMYNDFDDDALDGGLLDSVMVMQLSTSQLS